MMGTKVNNSIIPTGTKSTASTEPNFGRVNIEHNRAEEQLIKNDKKGRGRLHQESL